MFEPAVLSKGHHAEIKQPLCAHGLQIVPIKCARIFLDEDALQIQSDARLHGVSVHDGCKLELYQSCVYQSIIKLDKCTMH